MTGIVVLVPAPVACTTSAPPSTLLLSTTIHMLEVNPVPDTTVSVVAPAVLALPLVSW